MLSTRKSKSARSEGFVSEKMRIRYYLKVNKGEFDFKRKVSYPGRVEIY